MAKILLADDSTHAQRMGAKILSAEGIEVIAVSNGDAAVKKLVDADIDLVLADVYMPGLDGYEVCQWIKKSKAHEGVPVVLVVGALELYEPERIEQVKADGLLKKPFEASAMMDTLRPLLEASMKRPSKRVAAAILEFERTVAIAPPKSRDKKAAKPDDTVEIPPPPPDIDATIRIPPPPGATEIVAESAPFPTPPDSEPAMLDLQESAPLMSMEEAPPAMAVAPPVMEEAPPLAESYTQGEFEIPDVTGPQGQSVDAGLANTFGETYSDAPPLEDVAPPVMEAVEPEAAPPPPEPEPAPPEPVRWVAEPAEVTATDKIRFPEPVRAKADTPPDWGELLKSVEDTDAKPGKTAKTGAFPAPTPLPAPAPTPAPAPAASHDLELEIESAAAPEPPKAAPEVHEDEVRMAVQLCLENALPGLVDEITSAVMRRVKRD